jgi:single-strand DNA-binding protein
MSVKNSVQLIGGIGRDPEISKMSNGNSVVNFSVATEDGYVDRESKKWTARTEWINCVAYGKIAENIGKLFKKGSQVVVKGKLHNSSWEDKNGGGKRYKTEVVVEEWCFQKGNSNPSGNVSQNNAGSTIMDEDAPF